MRSLKLVWLLVLVTGASIGATALFDTPAFAGVSCPPSGCLAGCYQQENYCIDGGYWDCEQDYISCIQAADVAYAECINHGGEEEQCAGEQQLAYQECQDDYQSCRQDVDMSCSWERNLCIAQCYNC